jgi:hypothetical protein
MYFETINCYYTVTLQVELILCKLADPSYILHPWLCICYDYIIELILIIFIETNVRIDSRF